MSSIALTKSVLAGSTNESLLVGVQLVATLDHIYLHINTLLLLSLTLLSDVLQLDHHPTAGLLVDIHRLGAANDSCTARSESKLRRGPENAIGLILIHNVRIRPVGSRTAQRRGVEQRSSGATRVLKQKSTY